MKLRLLFALLFSTFAFAQTATLTGVILDKEMYNEPLPFANIMIKGTKTGTTTNENGKYVLTLKPGSYTLVIGYLGYDTKEIPFTLKGNEKKIINHTLESNGIQLDDVVIVHTVSKEKESALLQEQQKAVEIKQSIGAQEMSKKGISDVAAAVVKTTGITKQEGSGNIFVRGLGDRYNSTSMNGLPIPSNDPSNKNMSLDIFSTDIVEYVNIDKVYNSKMYGDFAGGNVDIISKDYNGSGFFAFGLKSAVNTNAISNNNFKLQAGPSFLGFTNIRQPSNALSGYNFSKSLNPNKEVPWASGISLSGGDKFKFGKNSSLSFFATLSFDNEYTSKSNGISRAVNSEGVATKDFNKYESNSYNTNTTGMFNLGFKLNNTNKFKYNTVFINSSNQSLDEYNGNIVDVTGFNGFVRRSTYVKNSLLINQLLGEHKYKERYALNWGVSYNKVDGNMPDRSTITLKRDINNDFIITNNSASDNQRYFQKLNEDEVAVNAAVDYKFGKSATGEFKGKFTLGYNGKYKQRDFEAIQYNFKINALAPGATTTVIDPNNVDAYFNQDNFNAGYFSIKTYNGGIENPNALNPQTYNGTQIVSSVFGNLEYKLSDKLFAIFGLRTDQIYQKVKWQTQIDPIGDKSFFTKQAFLPNLIAKYSINDKNNLRFAASKTYTLPQFKETAFFIYEDITQQYIGNPDLYPSDDYNVDIKWEFFPKSEEVIAVTGFGKYIQNPMNEVTISSSSNDITYINTGDWGYATGAELEIKKLLFNSENEVKANKISAGLNVSYMYTTQELDSEKVAKENNFNALFTDSKSSFTGASNLLLNGDVTFSKEWKKSETNLMTTLAFSTYSDRVYSLGTQGRGNVVEKSVNSLDFIIKSKLTKNLGLGFNVKNLLNPTIERVQENNNQDIVISSFKRGMNASLSLNYQF